MIDIYLKPLADFFNNQSVGAALGAFLAFALVVLTDWRRERRKLRTLRAEIAANAADARAKLETARRMRKLMREENKVMPAPVLRFNTSSMRHLAADVLHHLSVDQRRAVEGLSYTMEAIDELFAESKAIAQLFTGPLGHNERIASATHLLANWSDIIANLKRLVDMCELYLAGRYSELVNKQYNAADYEEG